MPVAFVAAYEKGSNVDKDYYVNKHIPLVTSTCKYTDTSPPLALLMMTMKQRTLANLHSLDFRE
jgi:hypothetical protein